jgi:anti-sigma B factor antagonist
MSESSPSFDLQITNESGTTVVRPTGEIDLHNSPALRTALLALAERKPSRVIIDLAGVTYVDSSGVGTLVEFKRRQERGGGGRVILAGLQPRVRSVFEITKLDQFFVIVANMDEARTK